MTEESRDRETETKAGRHGESTEQMSIRIVDDFESFTDGTTHDKVARKPIRLHAGRLLLERDDVPLSPTSQISVRQ